MIKPGWNDVLVHFLYKRFDQVPRGSSDISLYWGVSMNNFFTRLKNFYLKMMPNFRKKQDKYTPKYKKLD